LLAPSPKASIGNPSSEELAQQRKALRQTGGLQL